MKPIDRLLGEELGRQWHRAFVRLLAGMAILLILAWGAAARVAAVDPHVAAFSFPGTALALLTALAGAAFGGLLMALVLLALGRIVSRVRRRRGAVDVAPAGNVALFVVGLLALQAVPRFLVMPLQTSRGGASIPILSVAADRYVIPISALLVVEILLALAALILNRNSLWWRVRFLLGLAWCAALAWVITGPNLLRGEPLEWASALRSPALPQSWIRNAPRSLESWWPAVQVLLASALLAVVLLIIQDLAAIVRSFRRRNTSPAGPSA
jgi:hypothetical protein